MVGNFKWVLNIAMLSFFAASQGFGWGKCEKVPAPRLLAPEESGNNYFITAGFLLEQVRMTGTQYAYTKNGNALGATALPARGQILEPSFDLDWGVTVGLAHYFCNKNWTLHSRFDYLQSTGSANNSAGFNSNIVPIHLWRDQFFAALNTDLGVAGTGISNFTVSYYNLNIDVDRDLYIDENFSLSPHVGLKLSFIYDHVVTQFTGSGSDTVFSNLTDLNANVLTRTQKANFWGIGPSFGIDSDWYLFCDVSLFFEGTAAVLLGYSQASDAVVYSALFASSTSSSSPSLPLFSPAVQTLLGLKYERLIYCDTQKVIAKLGWDTSMYWNQWNHINTISESAFNSSLDTFQISEGNTFGLTGLLFSLTWNF
jgi:hypothetical protein